MSIGVRIGNTMSLDPTTGKLGMGTPIGDGPLTLHLHNFDGTNPFAPKSAAKTQSASDGYDGVQRRGGERSSPYKKADYGPSPYKKATYGPSEG